MSKQVRVADQVFGADLTHCLEIATPSLCSFFLEQLRAVSYEPLSQDVRVLSNAATLD